MAAEIAEERSASGGNKDNPFSFKSFVKRASTDGGVKAGGKREKKRKARAGTASDSVVVPFPEEGGDNPFSFKKFVKKQTLTGVSERSSSSDEDHSFSSSLDATHVPLTPSHPLASPPPTSSSIATPGTTSTAVKNKDKKPTTLSQKPFGPFAVSATENDSQRKKNHKRNEDKLFSDTDSDSDIFTNSNRDITSLSLPADVVADTIPASGLKMVGVPASGLKVVGVGKGEEGEEESVSVLRLSDSSDDDSVVMSHGQGSIVGIQSTEPQSERLAQQCSQLSAENIQLKEELKMFREKYEKEKHKNSKLHEQLQALRTKEAEETKALEDMVAKVEENLVTSTKRAMNAEAIVSKLKQEMQSLQAQLSQADAQSVHRHYEELLSGVRDKATYASRQLAMASMAADQSIRDLLSGVDTLKNVAEVLQFIDRISEIKRH